MARQFQSAGRSEVGKVRHRNEDAILVRDEAGLWVVADGLGGHAAGDYASALIVERLASVPRTHGVFDFIEATEDTLAEVYARLRHAAQARGVDMIGSTVVLLVHARGVALCGWVGDSRGYCLENGRLVQITRDHLYGVEDDGDRWSGGPAQKQPGGGVLTRAVGADASLFVDWVVAGDLSGTQFVLCSDGINKEMSDAEIEAALMHHASPSAALDEIFDTSLARAARDNLSAVIVRSYDGAANAAPATGDHLRETNRSLRALDDAHRLGEISRDDYRARRRALLETLTGNHDGDDGGSAHPPRKPGRAAWKHWLTWRR